MRTRACHATTVVHTTRLSGQAGHSIKGLAKNAAFAPKPKSFFSGMPKVNAGGCNRSKGGIRDVLTRRSSGYLWVGPGHQRLPSARCVRKKACRSVLAPKPQLCANTALRQHCFVSTWYQHCFVSTLLCPNPALRQHCFAPTLLCYCDLHVMITTMLL